MTIPGTVFFLPNEMLVGSRTSSSRPSATPHQLQRLENPLLNLTFGFVPFLSLTMETQFVVVCVTRRKSRFTSSRMCAERSTSCEVCCNPWRLHIVDEAANDGSTSAGRLWVRVSRGVASQLLVVESRATCELTFTLKKPRTLRPSAVTTADLS